MSTVLERWEEGMLRADRGGGNWIKDGSGERAEWKAQGVHEGEK